MIKVRVGQTWSRAKSELLPEMEVNITEIDDGWAFYKSSTGTGQAEICLFADRFTFVPQNDLEWLAANEPDWFHTDCRYIRRDDDRAMYCDDLSVYYNKGLKCYTKAEWQNMRYHLGLDKKPHYRLTGGEWVKV